MKIDRRQFLGQSLALSAAGYCSSLVGAVPDGKPDDKTEEWKQILASHHLVSLEIKTVQLRWPRLVGKNSRLDVHGRGPRETVCRLTTDKGASGWGMFLANADSAAAVLEKFKGKSLTEVFDPSVGILDRQARPLDFALHDLAGMILGVPVYEMLGHQGPEANLCYSGMIYFDDLEPTKKPAGIDVVLGNCWSDLEYGYRQLKVKIGRGGKWMEKQAGIERDVEITRKIAAIFSGVDVLVDGNDGFTCDEFIQYLDGIGDVKLFWIEEPFAEKRDDYARLRAYLETKQNKAFLADGEYEPDEAFVMALLKEKLIDVNLYDVCGYGFTAWRALLPTLKKMGALASPHAWGSRLKTNYTAHLATGLGGVVTIEGVTCASDEVEFGDYALKAGKLVTSAAPGFGMSLKG